MIFTNINSNKLYTWSYLSQFSYNLKQIFLEFAYMCLFNREHKIYHVQKVISSIIFFVCSNLYLFPFVLTIS